MIVLLCYYIIIYYFITLVYGFKSNHVILEPQRKSATPPVEHKIGYSHPKKSHPKSQFFMHPLPNRIVSFAVWLKLFSWLLSFLWNCLPPPSVLVVFLGAPTVFLSSSSEVCSVVFILCKASYPIPYPFIPVFMCRVLINQTVKQR